MRSWLDNGERKRCKLFPAVLEKKKSTMKRRPPIELTMKCNYLLNGGKQVTRIKTIQILSSERGSPTIGLWQSTPLLMAMDVLHGRSLIWRLLNQTVRQNAAIASLQPSWKTGTDIIRSWKALQLDREISQSGWTGF